MDLRNKRLGVQTICNGLQALCAVFLKASAALALARSYSAFLDNARILGLGLTLRLPANAGAPF